MNKTCFVIMGYGIKNNFNFTKISIRSSCSDFVWISQKTNLNLFLKIRFFLI